MANRLRRFQAWLESALTRAKSKELDVRYNPGLGVSNKPELEISKNTGLESSNKTSLETSNKLELETNRNMGLEANNMEHEISNESGLNISHKPGDSPSSDTSSQQEPPQANDTSSQQNPPPYCQHFGVRMLPKPTMPIKDDMPSIIRAAVGIAEVWSNAAHRAVRIVSEGVDRAGSSTRPLPDSTGGDRVISNRSGGDCSSGELSNTNPGLGGCEAVLQTVRLRAAIGALRNYGEDTHILAALNTLDAVAAGDYLPYTGEERLGGPTTCTCNRSCRRSCKALLQANRLRTALHALWTYNINVGNHKVVGVLAAVAAAAGLQPLPKDSDDSS